MIDVELNEKPNMDKLDNDPEDTNVEIPKPKAYPDRSSNSPSKNYKEIAEFNTEKSKTKSENMSSQSTSNNETEFSNRPRHSEGSQQAHQWGRQQLWEDVPESLDGGREADLGEIHQRLLPVLPHTLDSL